jgi:hypothetical protein
MLLISNDDPERKKEVQRALYCRRCAVAYRKHFADALVSSFSSFAKYLEPDQVEASKRVADECLAAFDNFVKSQP